MRSLLSLLLLTLASLAPEVWSARILGIFPTPSLSHQLPYQAVMKGLAARGHQVTVISTDPLKEPVANYTDIDLSFSYEYFRAGITFAKLSEIDPFTIIETINPVFKLVTDKQLGSKQVQDFLRYNASEGYDMVVMEWFTFDAYFGVYHAVGSPPLVGIISYGGSELHFSSVGNILNPAVNPDVYTHLSSPMTFWDRLYNAYMYFRIHKFIEWTIYPDSEELILKHFGPGLPPLRDTRHNLSLLMVCNHWSTEYPRPMMPNEVQLTGLQVRDSPPPLPAELKEWLDAAGSAGVIYFSLGTNVLSKDLPVATREAILRAFARLPQRVLWKWEEEDMPNRPENVRISKWLPQQSILAHPNVRLFVMQGGLQSLHEASYHAIPLIVIPFMGDQPYNAAKIHTAGIGKRILFRDLTEETLHGAIIEVLEDKGYKERMRRFSAVFREHKANSLENGVWWLEYVLRHNGGHHMRAASLDLAWYELLLLDIVAAVLVIALAGAFALNFITRALWRLAFSRAPSTAHRQKKVQ